MEEELFDILSLKSEKKMVIELQLLTKIRTILAH